MKRLTIKQKNEALTNALRSFSFPKKYFIVNADARLGHRFAIAFIKNDRGGISTVTSYMSYDEMNAFLLGYNLKKLNS